MLVHRGEITKEAYLYNSYVKQKFLLDYAWSNACLDLCCCYLDGFDTKERVISDV